MPYDPISTTEIFRPEVRIPPGFLVKSDTGGELQLGYSLGHYTPQVVSRIQSRSDFGPVTIEPDGEPYVVLDAMEDPEYCSTITRIYNRTREVKKLLKSFKPTTGSSLIREGSTLLLEVEWGSGKRSENKLFTVETRSLNPPPYENANYKLSQAADRHGQAFTQSYRMLQDTLALKRDTVNTFFEAVKSDQVYGLALVRLLDSRDGRAAMKHLISRHRDGSLSDLSRALRRTIEVYKEE